MNFRTTEDYLYGRGECIEGNTYLINEEPYNGMLYTFMSKEELQELVEECGFKVDSLEREEYWKNNLTERHTWWVVTLSKK